MDKHQQVKTVITDFIKFYHVFFVMSSLTQTVRRVNNGPCYFVAHLVGRVLTEKYGITVNYRSHCLHGWLNVDGVDYDSLYPSGYDKPVVDEWWLARRRYNERVMELGTSGDVGYTPTGYDYHYFAKAFFERWGVSESDVVGETLNCVSYYWKNKSTRRRRNARFKRRYLKYRTLPLFEYDKSVENLTGPHTHYYKGEFE